MPSSRPRPEARACFWRTDVAVAHTDGSIFVRRGRADSNCHQPDIFKVFQTLPVSLPFLKSLVYLLLANNNRPMTIRILAIPLLLLSAFSHPVLAQNKAAKNADENISALRKDIAEMKTDIAEIKESVRTIRKAFDMAREKASAVQKVSARLDSSSEDDFVMGRPDAPITIMEFFDFQCGFCAKFHKTTFKELKRTLIDTGKVRFIFRDYVLSMHAMAAQAASIASCAKDQGKYLEMHVALFEEPELLGQAKFQEIVDKVPGIDLKKLDACLQLPEHQVLIGDEGPVPSPEVQADMQEAERFGVMGTPAFIIGKTVQAGQDFDAAFVRGDQELSVFQSAIAQVSNEQ